MKIYCTHCGKYLGEIRDATIRRNISYVCEDCSIKPKPEDYKSDNFIREFFKGL